MIYAFLILNAWIGFIFTHLWIQMIKETKEPEQPEGRIERIFYKSFQRGYHNHLN